MLAAFVALGSLIQQAVDQIPVNSTEIISLLNQTLTTSQQQTDAINNSTEAYFTIGIISILSSMVLYVLIFGRPLFVALMVRGKAAIYLRRYRELTGGRNIIIMTHAQSGLFGSMITMSDCLKIERLIRKFKGTEIDLIINTFGGELFASIRIAHLLQASPNVRVVVPKYAWSGGTLITLGANRVLAKQETIFGAVDPQLGSLLYTFSAKHWQQILTTKGKDAKDETIAFAEYSKQIMKEMEQYLVDLTKHLPGVDREKLFETFLRGERTHGNTLHMKDFEACGIKFEHLDTDLPDRIIEALWNTSGVFGYGQKFRAKKERKPQ